MKFYFAARSSRAKELLQLAATFNEAGHVVTSRWIQGGHYVTDEDIVKPENQARVGMYAAEDLADIAHCDALVAFMEPLRTATRGGRHVEFGYALEAGKMLIVVGEPENAFYTHFSTVRVADIDGLLSWMLIHGR